MIGLSLSIEDTATPAIRRLAEGVGSPDLRRVAGRAGANCIRANFSLLDQSRPNALGGRRTHFYGQARNATQNPVFVGDDTVEISINLIGISLRTFEGWRRRRDSNPR